MSNLLSKWHIIGVATMLLAGVITAVVIWRPVSNIEVVDAQATIEDACADLANLTRTVDFNTSMEYDVNGKQYRFDNRYNRENWNFQ